MLDLRDIYIIGRLHVEQLTFQGRVALNRRIWEFMGLGWSEYLYVCSNNFLLAQILLSFFMMPWESRSPSRMCCAYIDFGRIQSRQKLFYFIQQSPTVLRSWVSWSLARSLVATSAAKLSERGSLGLTPPVYHNQLEWFQCSRDFRWQRQISFYLYAQTSVTESRILTAWIYK